MWERLYEMKQIYFEAKGEDLLGRIGMTKSEFARRMGIHRQNVGTLFKTKNLETIYKAAKDDIPRGNSVEDKRKRQGLIYEFYQEWKRRNPDQKKYNIALKEDINIRAVSLDETAAHASQSYLSTIAVLQLDAILTNARLVQKAPSKPKTRNQRTFESMLIMEYICPGIGRVKMTVGVKRSDKSKVQYCITAIDTDKIKQEVG